MNPGLVVKLRPAGPWRIGPDSGARNRVDAIYHSDSLYSAVTSAMSRMGSLSAWLDATARSQTPAVCFSSCFPFLDDIGFVVPPRTIWPPTSPQAMSARVRWKSARFIPLSVVESILSGKKLNENQWSVDGASGCLVPAGKAGPFRTSVRWNAAVDRLSGSCERHATACIEFREGCGLWTVAGFHDEAARDEWQDRVKAAFRLLADTGFGGERSRGWGRSETPEFVEGTLPGLIIEYRRKEARAAGVEPETAAEAPKTEPAASPSPEGETVAPEPVAEAAPEADAAPIGAATGVPPWGQERLPEAEPAPEAAPEVERAAPETELAAEPLPAAAPVGDPTVGSGEAMRPQAGVDRLKPVPPLQTHESSVVAQAGYPLGPPADLPAPETQPVSETAPEADATAPEAARVAELAPEAAAPETATVADLAPEGAAPETESAAEPAPEAEAAARPLPTPRGYPGRGSDGSAPETEPVAEAAPEAAALEAELTAEPAPEAAAPETEPVIEAAPETDATEPQAEPLADPALEAEAAAGPSPESAPDAETSQLGEEGTGQEAYPTVAVRAPDRTEAMRLAPEREAAPAKPAPSVRLQAHWLLSLFTPAADDAVDWGRGSYAVLARGGRIDSPSGSGELKKQIQMVTEGSVLFSDGVPLGAAPDVAPDGFAHPVFRAGFALAIPLPEVH
jgi:CRISPR type III-A-associated RAMP protein Csm4